MPNTQDIGEAAVAFKKSLALELEAWMNDHTPPIKQKELAERLGLRPSTVNNNLRNPASMSPNFIERVSKKIPKFSGSLAFFRDLMDSRFASEREQLSVLGRAAAFIEWISLPADPGQPLVMRAFNQDFPLEIPRTAKDRTEQAALRRSQK